MHSYNLQIRLMHAVRASVKMVAPSSARFSVSELFYSFSILFRESFKETQKKVGRVMFLQIKFPWKRFYVACDIVKDCMDIVTYTN